MSGQVGTATTGVSYGMTTITRFPEQAWEYMTWLGGEWFGVNAMLGGFIDPGGRRDAWSDPRMAELWALAPEVTALFENSEAEEVPWNLRHQEINRAFSGTAGEMFLNQIPIEEAAQIITDEIDEILSRPLV